MQRENNKIALNFLEINPKAFNVTFYRKKLDLIPAEEQRGFYIRNLKESIQSIKKEKFAIVFQEKESFDKIIVTQDFDIDITKQLLFNELAQLLLKKGITPLQNNKDKYHRFYLPLNIHKEGTETVWIEPFFF
jgi:hypothetical protein